MQAARRIVRISRVVAELDRSESFYRSALGFRTMSRATVDPASLAALGVAHVTADEVVMRLGSDEIALVQFRSAGNPYPADSRSNDLWFQHLAIVVRDMDAGYAHLSRNDAWRPISTGGPQTLPAANGGVRAFKFRDPDGHPLELLWLPPGSGRSVWHEPAQTPPALPFLGIDHSALAVSSVRRSVAFYTALGMRLAGESLNHGPAQCNLDGLPAARVEVTALRPGSDLGPGLELLAYQPPGRTAAPNSVTNVSTDWVTLAVAGTALNAPRAVSDPDGHLLVLEDLG